MSKASNFILSRRTLIGSLLILPAVRLFYKSDIFFGSVNQIDLQAMINAAQPGDTIILPAGESVIGPIALPDKGDGTAYITIQSSRASELSSGVRVSPADAPKMFRIRSPGGGEAALQTVPRAHHYKLIGIEVDRVSPDAAVFDLVKLGDGTIAQNSYDQVPHHLGIDRCYIHGDSGDLKRGIALNSAHTEIVNSYVSEFHVVGQEAQAIGGWNGPGPFRIVNNYIEGAGENLMFGGAIGGLPNLVPSDIEILRNDFDKPVSWRGVWTVKNLLELKNARRVRIEGNNFGHNWLDAQQGYSILFTPRPSDSGAAAVVEDIDFINNIVRNVAAGVHIVGRDSLYAAGPTETRLRRIRVRNNLFEDVNHIAWGGDGTWLKVHAGTEQVSIEHNTVFQTGNISKSGDAPNLGYIFRDNIVRHNEFGVHGDGVGYGNPALDTYFPGADFTKNVIAKEFNAPWNTELVYPAGNSFPESYNAIGFLDLAGGNYRLAANSPYKRAGTNGTDPGCDIDALEDAMNPVPTPSPTPTATPIPTPTATPSPSPSPSPSPKCPPGWRKRGRC